MYDELLTPRPPARQAPRLWGAQLRQRLLVFALALCTGSGCGGARGSLIDAEPAWRRSSDQEELEILRHAQGALWAVAQGQLLAWRMDSERLYRASTPLPSSLKMHDIWVEEADSGRLNQVRARSYEAYIKRLKSAQQASDTAGAPAPSKGQQDSLIDLDGIEIEGEEEPSGIGGGGEVQDDDSVDLDLSDMVIDTTSPAPSARRSAKRPKLPSPPPKVKWRYRVYVASSKGLYQREVWLDEQWRDLLGDQAWRLIQKGAVTQLAPRLSGGLWWSGERGFGWAQRGRVGGRLERGRAAQITARPGGGAWVVMSDPSKGSPALVKIGERIWSDGGEPLNLDQLSFSQLTAQLGGSSAVAEALCQGELIRLLTTSEGQGEAQRSVSYALCTPEEEGGPHTLALFKGDRWWPMRFTLPTPLSASQVSAWGSGLIIRQGERWWVSREGRGTISVDAQGPSSTQLSLQLSAEDLRTQGAPALHLARLELDDSLPIQEGSAWSGGRGEDGAPWLSWARPHQGVVSRVGATAKLRKRLQTESFAAYNETRPYSLDEAGTLWVPQLGGASTYPVGGAGWGYVAGPEGRTLGVAHCPQGALFVVSRRQRKPKPSLTLELWRPGAEEPSAQLDWSDALFRAGEPKLGDLSCDRRGAIYGALFWGPGWSGSGVGVMHLPADRSRVEVWGARQGYDGEEELTETPLLPDFTLNAIATAPDGRVFFATNGGLAVVDPPAERERGRRKLTLLSESTGWVTDFINDLSVGEDGRVWVATDKGLYVLDKELKSRLTTLKLRISAVAVDRVSGLIWVALHDKLYRGDGFVETWRKVQVSGSFPVGSIKRVLPFEPSAQSGEGQGSEGLKAQVWLATTRGLLRASAQR